MNRHEYVKELHDLVRRALLSVVDGEMLKEEVVQVQVAGLGVILNQVYLASPSQVQGALNDMHRRLDAVAFQMVVDHAVKADEDQRKEPPEPKLRVIYPAKDDK